MQRKEISIVRETFDWTANSKHVQIFGCGTDELHQELGTHIRLDKVGPQTDRIKANARFVDLRSLAPPNADSHRENDEEDDKIDNQDGELVAAAAKE